MDTSLNIKDKLNMSRMTYSIKGTGTIINNKIFGFTQDSGDIVLINPITLKPLDNAYSIRYLDAKIVILSRRFGYLKHISKVLNIDTFEEIYTTPAYLHLENNIIYESPGLINSITNNVKVLNKDFKELHNIDVLNSMEVKAIDDDYYYLVTYNVQKELENEEYQEDQERQEIFYYNEANNIFKLLHSSGEYDINIISNGLCSFHKKHDYQILFIYDFINHEMISEQI